jgi:hypothetical protein
MAGRKRRRWELVVVALAVWRFAGSAEVHAGSAAEKISDKRALKKAASK